MANVEGNGSMPMKYIPQPVIFTSKWISVAQPNASMSSFNSEKNNVNIFLIDFLLIKLYFSDITVLHILYSYITIPRREESEDWLPSSVFVKIHILGSDLS